MKRSARLRRTPLKRRAGISTARKRLQQVSSKRRAQAPDRRAAEDALYAQRPYCWMCGRSGELRGDGPTSLHGHEILSRAQGGDPTHPDALLCNICNGWCEDNPIEAAWLGWKFPKKHPVIPCIGFGDCRPWEHVCVEMAA